MNIPLTQYPIGAPIVTGAPVVPVASITTSSETRTFYTIWIIFIIITFIITLILNIVFIYLPLARIENAIETTARDIETTLNKVETVAADVDIAARGAEKLLVEIDPFIAKLEAVYCNFFPNDSICPAVSIATAQRIGTNNTNQINQRVRNNVSNTGFFRS